jgi:hypothetical protein
MNTRNFAKKSLIGLSLLTAGLGTSFAEDEKLAAQKEMFNGMIMSAMRIGELCALIPVEKNAKKGNKPLSLKELSKESDICVRENLKKYSM